MLRSNHRAFSVSSKVLGENGPWFGLSPEQKEFQAVARKFAREEIMPVAAHHDRTGEYPKELVKKAWELGFLNPHIPTELGGLNLDILTTCITGEEITYGCSGIGAALSISAIAVIYNIEIPELIPKYLNFSKPQSL